MMYTKLVNKGSLEYCYLSIRLDYEEESCPELTAVLFKRILLQAVTALFGVAGECNQIDVLRFNESDGSAIIRIRHKFLVKFWSSLTLFGEHDGYVCAFRVLQVSAHLMALAHNSRTMPVKIHQS